MIDRVLLDFKPSVQIPSFSGIIPIAQQQMLSGCDPSSVCISRVNPGIRIL
jgi:hypothetical protein